jgi:hypothetical protein
MEKLTHHPNAYLKDKKNVRQGLNSRSKVLRVLEMANSTAKSISQESDLSYNVVLHHLHLLENERIVLRKTQKKPYLWTLSGIGQQRLEVA